METGTIFKFHNDLDTDQIIASQYLLSLIHISILVNRSEISIQNMLIVHW